MNLRDLDGSPRLSARLALGAAAFAVAAVPVTILGYAATHGWGPLHSVDQGAADRLHTWAVGATGAVSFLQWVSTILHPWSLRVVAAGAVIWLIVSRQLRLALWVAVTILGAGILDYVLKDVVHRTRPVLPDAVASAPGYSFPSGHALASIVAFGVALLLVLPLLHRGWKALAWAVAIGCVLLVGFARVGLGVHYVSDVVAGWLIGLGWLGMTVAVFESWRRAEGRHPRQAGEIVEEGIDPAGSKAAADVHSP